MVFRKFAHVDGEWGGELPRFEPNVLGAGIWVASRLGGGHVEDGSGMAWLGAGGDLLLQPHDAQGLDFFLAGVWGIWLGFARCRNLMIVESDACGVQVCRL
jgi:hypothetical protein